MAVPIDKDTQKISSTNSTCTQTTTSSSSSESLTVPDDGSGNWKRKCRPANSSRQSHDADESESSEHTHQQLVPATIPKHSTSSTVSIDSYTRPKRCVPSSCDDFFDAFHRKPTHFQNLIIPDDDITVAQAHKLLSNDPFAPGILGISTIDYDPSPCADSACAGIPYVRWLALSTPSGKTCAFNIKNRGLPSLIRDLLLSNRFFFVGFGFSRALGNSDVVFQGIGADFEVFDCLGNFQ